MRVTRVVGVLGIVVNPADGVVGERMVTQGKGEERETHLMKESS